MDAEGVRGFRNMAGMAFERPLNVEFFEFRDRFVEQYMPVEHFVDQVFHLVTHNFWAVR